MAAQPTESVRGVISNTRCGNREYDLIVTDRRILAAVVGSVLNLPVLPFFTNLPVSMGGREAAYERYRSMNLDQIFASDPKNFSIPLTAIRRALLDGGVQWVTLPVLTVWVPEGPFRFEFTNSTLKKDYAGLRFAKDVLSAALPGRLKTKHV